MTRRATLRASDADREHVAERLRVAATEGRLLAEELDERLGAALSARTYGELDALVSDLPASHAVTRSDASHPIRIRRALLLIAIPLGLVLAAALGHVLDHEHQFGHDAGGAWVIWLVWLAIGWRMITRRRSRGR